MEFNIKIPEDAWGRNIKKEKDKLFKRRIKMEQNIVVVKFVGSDKSYDFYDHVGLEKGYMYMIEADKRIYTSPVLVVGRKSSSIYSNVSITGARRLVTLDSVLRKRDHSAIKNLDKILFSNGRTIVLWKDGTKTIVNCQEGDRFSKETGIALAFMKKFCGNDSSFNEVLQKYAYGDVNKPSIKEEIKDLKMEYQL